MISTAIIGCGMSARTFHLPLLAANPDFHLTALVSSKSHPDLQVTRYETATKMLAQSDVELVIITTPNTTHYALAKECLQQGRHVVLEKPMVNCVSEGEALITLAAKHKCLLSVFHNRRWDSDFLTLKRLLHKGTLGELRLFVSHWDRFRPEVRNRWRENQGEGAGIWYDLGAHLLDQVLVLFGMPQAVTGHCRALRPAGLATDYAHVQLHYDNFEVILHTSPFACAPNSRFRVEGSAGTFVQEGLDGQEAQLKAGIMPYDDAYGVVPSTQWGTFYTPDGYAHKIPSERGDFPFFYRNLAAAIRGEASLAVSTEAALQVIYLIELAQRSSDEGRRIIL
ncbi:MAG: Gfo/Idh/MocA family oxidoreductase [Cardiobacteriaceae bacterium]|nr:Gfo/Idh/MocA family oxidoreductase [Cardiobacteriaceae bacterium]